MSLDLNDASVVHEGRTVVNPLSDETINLRRFINNLIEHAKFDVLRALKTRSTPTGIENRGITSRKTASKHFAEFERRGLAIPTKNESRTENELELSIGGQLLVDEINRCLRVVDRDQLADLTRSPNSICCLRALGQQPWRPGDLAVKADSPSRMTVWRYFDLFAGFGWCEASTAGYALAPIGNQILHSYGELLHVAEQTIAKAPFLQRLSPPPVESIEFPIHALDDAELVFSSPTFQGLATSAALKLCDPRTRHYRTLTSIFNPRLFRMYHGIVKLGMDSVGVIDASVYEHICKRDDLHFLFDNDTHDHYQLLRLEESLTLGIGLYDNRKVAIGAYNETGDGNHIAVIISAHDELIEWGTAVFNYYRERAVRPEVPS